MTDWFLYLVISWGGQTRERLLAMPDEETCITHLVSARMEVNDGGDNEHAVFAACTQDVSKQQRNGATLPWNPSRYEWHRIEEAE